MKRLLTRAVLAAACLACGGCLVVATVAAVGALAISTNTTTSKAPKPAVEAASQPAPAPAVAAVAPATPAAQVTRVAPVALTAESAAKLSQPDAVVVLDLENGTSTNLPWQEGMTLAAATAAGKPGSVHSARIFRGTRELPADLRQDWTAALALLAGDVIELRR